MDYEIYFGKRVRTWMLVLLAGACFLSAGSVWSDDDCVNPLLGTEGDDVLIGTDCDQRIRGEEGDDTIFGRGGVDNVEGNKGDDEIHGEVGDDDLNGGPGNDKIEGGPGDDRLQGIGGDDVLLGDGGDDLLQGGSNADYLDGGPGNDRLEGFSGDDFLDDAEGTNTLDGGSEHDVIVGRTGLGVLRGGTGDDFIIIVGQNITGYELIEGGNNQTSGGSDLLFFARDASPDMAYYENGERLLRFDLRTQEAIRIDLADVVDIEAVATGDGDDQVIGTDSISVAYEPRLGGFFRHELFFTAGGNDAIETGEGDDFVDAGSGNDTVTLGTGACHLIGGDGRDTFIWSEAALMGNKVSRITDLAPGDIVQWQGSWQPDDVALDEAQGEDQVATMVRLGGVRKLILEGVAPSDVRVRQARESLWIDVLRSPTHQPSLPKGATPLFGG